MWIVVAAFICSNRDSRLRHLRMIAMAINDDDDKDFQLSLTLLPRSGSQSWVLGFLLPGDLARTLLTTPRPPDKDGEDHRGKVQSSDDISALPGEST